MSKLISKYLNSLEEVKNALLAGKKVWYIDVDGHQYYLKFEKGLILCYYGNEIVSLSPLIVTSLKYFLRENVKIRMEVETFYRLRNGDKAICVYEETRESTPRPFKMEVLGDRNRSFYVDKDGEAYMAEDDVMDYWEYEE